MSMCEECAREIEHGSKHTCNRDAQLAMMVERLNEEIASLRLQAKQLGEYHRNSVSGLNSACADMRKSLNESRAEAQHWKANHDNMCALNAALRERPDLTETQLSRSSRVTKVIAERDLLKKQLEVADAIAYKATRPGLSDESRQQVLGWFHEHISIRNSAYSASVASDTEAIALQSLTHAHEEFHDDDVGRLHRSELCSAGALVLVKPNIPGQEPYLAVAGEAIVLDPPM